VRRKRWLQLVADGSCWSESLPPMAAAAAGGGGVYLIHPGGLFVRLYVSRSSQSKQPEIRPGFKVTLMCLVGAYWVQEASGRQGVVIIELL